MYSLAMAAHKAASDALDLLIRILQQLNLALTAFPLAEVVTRMVVVDGRHDMHSLV